MILFVHSTHQCLKPLTIREFSWYNFSFEKLINRVHFPDSVGKILSLLVCCGTRLFYIRLKIFFYFYDPWILLFRLIYYWSFILHAFMEKSAVYEKYLPLSQLGFVSLIMSVSKKLSLITTVLIKCIEKFHFRKKTFFSSFSWEIEERCLWHFFRADEILS